MITRRAFTAGLVSAPALLRAQAPQPPVPLTKSQQRGNELVAQAVAALGGDKFLNMQDRLESGQAAQFYHERVSGYSLANFYTRYPESPNPAPVSFYGIQERQTFGKKHDDVVLFNPDGGWEVTYRGVRPLPDETVGKHKETVISNFIYILRQRLHEPGLIFDAHGVDVVDNQRVERLDLIDNADRAISIYLAAESKLPVSQRYMRFDPFYKEKIEEVTRWSKYRDTGNGVMWPYAITREHDGEIIYQLFSDKVTLGNNFDAGLFTLPRGMQTLKKENS